MGNDLVGGLFCGLLGGLVGGLFDGLFGGLVGGLSPCISANSLSSLDAP